MKLGEFNVFDCINTLGYDNTKWSSFVYIEEKNVKEETGFGENEKVYGFVVYVWIEKMTKWILFCFKREVKSQSTY